MFAGIKLRYIKVLFWKKNCIFFWFGGDLIWQTENYVKFDKDLIWRMIIFLNFGGDYKFAKFNPRQNWSHQGKCIFTMENCNVMIAFVPDACRQMCVSFLHFLVKHSALQLPCYLLSSLVETFLEYRRIWSKKIFYRLSNS